MDEPLIARQHQEAHRAADCLRKSGRAGAFLIREVLMVLSSKRFAACAVFWLSMQVFAQPNISSGRLVLQGAVVESVCETGVVGSIDFGPLTRLVEVTPRVMLAVNMAREGCGADVVPFVTSFQLIQPSAYSEDASGSKGIVTISYL